MGNFFASFFATYFAGEGRLRESFSGDLVVEQFQGGQSNPTFRVTAGERRYVLRVLAHALQGIAASRSAVETGGRARLIADIGWEMAQRVIEVCLVLERDDAQVVG